MSIIQFMKNVCFGCGISYNIPKPPLRFGLVLSSDVKMKKRNIFLKAGRRTLTEENIEDQQQDICQGDVLSHKKGILGGGIIPEQIRADEAT